MISIKERECVHVTGETSFFVQFNYRPEYVDIVKRCSGAYYSKKDRTWEIPVIYLSDVLDEFCVYDDINLELLQDRVEESVDASSIQLADYKIKPFPYQEEGIKYGLTHDKWLLLDCQGTGKTMQTIHIAEEHKIRDGIQHCLIICGLSSLKANWAKEIEKHSNLDYTILDTRITKTGSKQNVSIKDRTAKLLAPIDEFFIITSISSLRDKDFVAAIKKSPNKIDMVAFDEVHKCKDASSLAGQGLMKISGAKYLIAATGTMIMNSPLDAYVPLKWIGVEKSSFTNFKYAYLNDFGGFRNMDLLKYLIDKHSLRRTKDVLNLPPKTVVEEYVDMDYDQYKFYDNIKHHIKDQVDKVEIKKLTVLSMVGRLREVTACPSMLTTENIGSAKQDRACDLIEQITSQGDKVVVFSTFKETVHELSRKLGSYNPLVCTGDESDDIVETRRIKFQTDPNYKVILCTWQRMGTGVDLYAANYVIFIDTPYTFAVFDQACDRCHRIGTTKPVIIYHLITKDTVDERVRDILNLKSALSGYLVDDVLTDEGFNILKRFIEEL